MRNANLGIAASPDDGGSPITHYLVEKCDMSRGSWVEAEITTDLKCTVRSLTHRKTYLMRVKAVNAVGESEPTTLDKSFIAQVGRVALLYFSVFYTVLSK